MRKGKRRSVRTGEGEGIWEEEGEGRKCGYHMSKKQILSGITQWILEGMKNLGGNEK